jgi:hypothetical protein
MELGNLVFGNSRGEAPVPRSDKFEAPWQELCDRLKLNWYGYENDGCLVPEKDGVLQNDVFAVRSYDWHSECTCGASEKMDAWHAGNSHKPTCYQAEYNAEMDAYDVQHHYRELEKLAYSDYSSEADSSRAEAAMAAYTVVHDLRDDFDDKVRRKLCAAHGMKFPEGSMMHCDCGYDQQAVKYWDEMGGHAETCRLTLPNFLYKPTGFRINWYKYPFRDSYMTPRITPKKWREIVKHCIESVVTPAINAPAQSANDHNSMRQS